MMTFNKSYFGLAVLIFSIELFIALFVRDNFVRPYVGDVLVVIFIYCLVKAFLRLKATVVALFVLLFAFTVEFLQFFNVVDLLGLEKSGIARTVIGTSFAWLDLLAYIVGTAVVLIGEEVLKPKRTSIVI